MKNALTVPEAVGLGRSRGGLTTKIHALFDADGLPIVIKLSEGQAHEGPSATDMINSIGAGQILLADAAYDSDRLRQTLCDQGAWANVKPMPTCKNIPTFSRVLYRYRNLVERVFNKIKHFRAIAARFEKHAANYLALVKLASIKICMRVKSISASFSEATAKSPCTGMALSETPDWRIFSARPLRYGEGPLGRDTPMIGTLIGLIF